MMTAEKGNKVYTITEAEKENYQSQGYDIYEGEKRIAYGKGKTVPYEDFMKLQEENEELRKKLGTSEKTVPRKTEKSR